MKSRPVIATVLSAVFLGLLLILVAGSVPASLAQTPKAFQPVLSRDIAHDTSAPLRDLAQLSTAPTRPSAVEAINRRRPNRFDDPKFLEGLKEQGIDLTEYLASLAQPDAVVQGQIGVPYAPNAMPPTLHNFEGVSQNEMQAVVPGTSDNYIPPDTDGDVGYDPVTGKKYYVQYINTAYAIWDVTDPTPTRLITATGNALWFGFGGICEASNDGDPIVLFDQLSNRWLMSQFALPGGTDGFHQCIAISQSGDPTGAWYRYDFLLSTTKLNDYPKFGIWPDAYYMSINQFNSSGTAWLGAGALAFERQRMLQGLSAQMIYFDLFSVNADFGGQLPSDWDGMTPPPAGAPNYFVEVDDDSVAPALGPDAMRLWKFHVDWTTPANSTFGVNGTPNYTMTVSPFTQICPTTRSCVPQPGTSSRLDAIGDRVMFRGAYRNINGHETLVVNHTVDAGSSRAGVRWYEVRDVGTAPVIYQQSTYAPADTEHRWMGSIAMDHVGNIALGYSTASSTVFPSVRYTGRLASDPLGVMAQGESSIISGTGSQTDSAARWGDYSSMTLDPVDDCTFWYTQEYYAVTSARDWQTRIASFKFPNCTLGPQGVLEGSVTNASNSSPLVGARVEATLSPTQTFTAFSNPSGNYNLFVPVGTYTLTGSAYGFLPQTIVGVAVVSGTTTTQNIALTPAASYVISGFVRDSATNDPLWATVAVIGMPFNPPFASVQTDPATGFYSMTVSGGQSYTLTASALLHTAASQGVTPVGDTTVNFNLVATTQNGGIAGWVRNYYTDDPIPNAAVTVDATGNPSDQTDANGYFEILNLPPGIYTATATANLYSPVSISNIQVLSSNVAIRTFLLPTSQLSYAPAQLTKTLSLGQIVTDTAGLVISNTGLGALTFELQEVAGGFSPLRLLATDYLVVGTATSSNRSITQSLTALGFTYEITTESAFNALPVAALLPYGGVIYASSSSTGISKLVSYLDNGGRLLVVDNDFGFSNGSSAFYQQYLEAHYDGDDATNDGAGTVVGEDIMNGLSAGITDDPFPDYYTITGTNTTRVFVYSTAGPGNNGPAGSRTARNGYQVVYLPFDIFNLGTSAVGEPIETDVLQRALTWLGGATYDAIPWLVEAPISGTLVQSNAQNIQLVWNASVAQVAQPGTYTGTLQIDNNDPNAQNASVPVVMQVNPAASQGLLTGVVSSTGVCDINPAPLNGARVFIEGSAGFTVTLGTNAAGQYGYWLDQAQSPYTVTVSYADHPTTTVSVGVTGGMTTTQNFTLRLQKACITASPNDLQATAQLGSAAPNQTVYVTSSGALPLDFNVVEVPSNLTIGGGPDAFGYTWITATYNFIDATGGTPLGLTDDSEANIVSPFPIAYYGGTTTNLRVGNNGAILFGATTGDVSTANTALASAPDNFIAPFWDDIDDETGNVYWLVTGTAPNRKLVVEWYNRPHYVSGGGVGQATWEVVIFENGNILYQYLDTDFGNASFNDGVSATAGIRGVGALNSLEYSFNQAKLTNGLAICFVRPGNAPCDAVDIPWLTVTPTSTVGLTGTPPSSQQLTVGFDATSLPLPGAYTANLLIAHNAPQPAVNIPVTFTVTPPASYGQINGVVNGLAVCDAPGAPLNGATVAISGGTVATATTNANGEYSYYLLGGNAYTLTVSQPGYVGQQAVVNVTQQQTTTTNFNLRLVAPCQSLSASSISSSQPTNQVTTSTLIISNSGASALNWNFLELAPALGPITPLGDVTKQQMSMVVTEDSTPLALLANIVQDGSFELGTPNAAWDEYSLQFNTPLCNPAPSPTGCGTGGGTAGPRTGNWWVWFGGTSGVENAYVTQTVVITSGSAAQLIFWFRIGVAGDGTNDFMHVLLDNTEIFSATKNTTGYSTYTQVVRDVSAFADGQPHVLRFESTTNDTTTSAVTNFNVDDVVLDVTGPTCSANALPWVGAVPASGTTAPDNSSNVGIVFDSTGLSTGVYTGTLCLNTNSTVTPQTLLPVTLTVTAPPAQLTVNYVGNGTVNRNPLPPYSVGDIVTLTAMPDSGWAFSGWSGDLTGSTNPITIALTGNNVVTATFVSTCVPVAGVDFTYAPPAPKVGQPVTFNGTAMTGTAPITYTWNFGDGSSAGNGSPVTHLFPAVNTVQSYTVTLIAQNACGSVPVAKVLQIQPLTVFLPLITR